MKRKLALLSALAAAALLLSGCGVVNPLSANTNLQQTNVVLSQKNFHIVKNVSASVSASYFLGIGGLSQWALHRNAVAELVRKAELTGSQALANVNVKISGVNFFIYQKFICSATATVIEFDQ